MKDEERGDAREAVLENRGEGDSQLGPKGSIGDTACKEELPERHEVASRLVASPIRVKEDDVADALADCFDTEVPSGRSGR